MKTYLIPALAVLVLIGSAGCSKSDANIVGKWKPVMDVPPDKKNDPQTTMAMSMLQNMNLEFTADHKFNGMMMEGTWKLDGSTLHMDPTKMMGMDVKDLKAKNPSANVQNMDMTLSGDGKTLTPVKQTNGGPAMKFTKAT